MSIFLSIVALITSAHAGDCRVSVNREACPGKETEAFAPYGGQNPTISVQYAESLSQCQAIATKHAKVVRVKIIKKITVSPFFDNAPMSLISNEKPCGMPSRR